MGLLPLLAGAGLAVGLVLGLVGAGGGIIAVPALILATGMPYQQASALALAAVAGASITALIGRPRGSVRWKTAALMAVSGLPAAALGSLNGRAIPELALNLLFLLLLGIALWRMLAAKPFPVPHPQPTGLPCIIQPLAVGLAVGYLTGLLGVGGGFLIVPALVLLLGLNAKEAVGTSLAVIAANSLAGLAGSASALWGTATGPTFMWQAVTFAGAAMVAALLASLLGRRVPERIVTKAFAGVVVLAGLGMLASTVMKFASPA